VVATLLLEVEGVGVEVPAAAGGPCAVFDVLAGVDVFSVLEDDPASLASRLSLIWLRMTRSWFHGQYK
jgi:hypothetical protein